MTASTKLRWVRFLRPVVSPRFLAKHRVARGVWQLNCFGLLFAIPIFLLGFLFTTVPNLSYINGHLERQTVVSLEKGGTCTLGRSTGHRYVVGLTPLPDGQGSGGSFRVCDSSAPAPVGGTLGVYVRSDGQQKLRIDVNTVTDDLEDTLFVYIPLIVMLLIALGIDRFRKRGTRGASGMHEVPSATFARPPEVEQPTVKELRRIGTPSALQAAEVLEAQQQAGDLPSAPPPGYRPPPPGYRPPPPGYRPPGS